MCSFCRLLVLVVQLEVPQNSFENNRCLTSMTTTRSDSQTYSACKHPNVGHIFSFLSCPMISLYMQSVKIQHKKEKCVLHLLHCSFDCNGHRSFYAIMLFFVASPTGTYLCKNLIQRNIEITENRKPMVT